MVRSELVARLARLNPPLTRAEADRVVAAMLGAIVDALAEGRRVELRGFGAFSARAREARVGRNPRSGSAVPVEAKRVIYFRPGKELRLRLNPGLRASDD
jgi:integration host factor subunit beta